MSWFDSKKLQTYAKSTLLQAQKQIDKVLDIKEEEILNNQNNNVPVPVITNELPQDSDTITDNFFTSFLNQEPQKLEPAVKKSSTTLGSSNFNFEDFLNQDSKKLQVSKHSQSKTNTNSPCASSSTTPTISLVENASELESEQTETEEKLNKKISPINNKRPQSKKNDKSLKNRSKVLENAKQQNSKIEQEKIEKQNWVKNYVDSDGGNLSNSSKSENLDETLNEPSSNELITLKPEPKDEMLVSINSVPSEVETELKIETSTEKEHKDDEVVNKNEETIEKPIEISPNSTSSNISVEYSESKSKEVYTNSPKKTLIAKNTSLVDFVKVDGGSSLSGNASSNEEPESEICPSEVLSDIEVLSLPSNSGDQAMAVKNKQQNDKQNQKNSQLIASKTVVQILVKSPPPIVNNKSASQKQANSDEKIEATSAQVLEAREAHIIKLNTQNVKFQEENDNLINELEKVKYETSQKIASMQNIQDEMKAKLEKSSSDKEQFIKLFNQVQSEFKELKTQVEEKDEQLEQLTQEGVKLSKQELNQSNIIKKLRVKEKETETNTIIVKNELDKAKKELQELKSVLETKEETEKQYSEMYKKLEKGASLLEKELTETKMNYEDSLIKTQSLENTLQNSFKELAELHRTNAQKTSQINEATSSIESQYKEEIQLAVDKERIVSGKKIETLKWELECVRTDISRIEQQHTLREDMLRKEIADLQHQLRDTEMRNNELSQNISTATRPLLRQIENLQHSNSNQIESLENSEKNLIERLKEVQGNLCELNEKTRYDQETIMDLEQKIHTFEAQIQTLKSEKSKLNAEFQLAKSNLDKNENESYEKEAETKVHIGSLQQQVDKLLRDKKHLEIQIDVEKSKYENEVKRHQIILNKFTQEKENQQRLIEKQKDSFEQRVSIDEDSSPKSLKRFSSGNKIIDIANKHDNLEQVNSQHGTGNINILEGLQSKLKQKDGEILQLQNQIIKLENIRESMAKELVSLSNKLESISEQLKEYPELQKNYQSLNTEYNALLQMYGEKSEEYDELKLDLQDVKEMYKLQIEDLIKRST